MYAARWGARAPRLRAANMCACRIAATPRIVDSHIGKKAPNATMAAAEELPTPSTMIARGTQAIGGTGRASSIGPDNMSERRGMTMATAVSTTVKSSAMLTPIETRYTLAITSAINRPCEARSANASTTAAGEARSVRFSCAMHAQMTTKTAQPSRAKCARDFTSLFSRGISRADAPVVQARLSPRAISHATR